MFTISIATESIETNDTFKTRFNTSTSGPIIRVAGTDHTQNSQTSGISSSFSS
jgi:hypothetical protein